MPVPIILPKFGFTLETADIVKWLKHEGETVRSGDPICEVTTDKVNMEVEAPEAGTLYNLLYAEGATVPVTQVICYLLRPGEAPPAGGIPAPVAAPAAAPAEAAPSAPTAPAAPKATPVAQRMAEAAQVDLAQIQGTGPGSRVTRRDVETALAAVPSEPGKVRATPAARHIAQQAGVDLQTVAGTGPRGRIQAHDVQQALSAPPPVAQPVPPAVPPVPPASSAGVEDMPRTVKMEGMRRTIANRLQKSFQTAPHIFFEADIDMTGIEALRARLKARNEKLSVTAIVVKAVAGVLLRHPDLNATTDGESISFWPTANIGVAVALEAGLIVPVVHHAERLTLRAIQSRVDDAAARARQNGLGVADMVDGTFTISNLGMFGVDRFTAIINPPQVAILAVGRTTRQFVPDEAGQPVLKSLLTITLSADHRVVDGAQAAQFMADLRNVLEDPALLAW